MKVVFEKFREDGSVEKREFEITEIRYTNFLVGINIVDVGWRTLMPEQFDNFTVTKE